jgi:hypothetical protein
MLLFVEDWDYTMAGRILILELIVAIRLAKKVSEMNNSQYTLAFSSLTHWRRGTGDVGHVDVTWPPSKCIRYSTLRQEMLLGLDSL